MNKLALYLITLLGLCLTQPKAHAMSVQWTDYGYDNNGNVTELYDGDSGEIVGQYEYDPYGNTIKAEGQAARENNIRFSTKEYDSSTGLYYYGYRYYDPTTGRWPSRDPIEEEGGYNLYAFVANDGVNKWDVLGLCDDCSGQDKGSKKAVISNTRETSQGVTDKEWANKMLFDGSVIAALQGFANMPLNADDVLRLAVQRGISGNGSAGVRMIQNGWALRQANKRLGKQISVDYECYECKSCLWFCKSWKKVKSDTYRSPLKRRLPQNARALAEAAARRQCN